jgi:hypothetical protein
LIFALSLVVDIDYIGTRPKESTDTTTTLPLADLFLLSFRRRLTRRFSSSFSL